MMENNNYLGMLIRKDVAEVQSVGNAICFLAHSICHSNGFEKDLYDLTAKYKNAIEQVEFNSRSTTPFATENSYDVDKALYYLDQNKRKYFRELTLLLYHNVNGFSTDYGKNDRMIDIDWIYNPINLDSVFRIIAESFLNYSKPVLNGTDNSWVENQVRKYMQSILKWQNPLSDERMNTNDISYIKAIFGMYYSFARDLETLLLQKNTIYSFYNKETLTLSLKDADHFGDMLSDRDKIPPTFEKQRVTLVPPFNSLYNNEDEVHEEELKEMEEERIKVEEKKKEFCEANLITDEVKESFEESGELHSYLWFKKQLVMIVSSYISLEPNVQIDKFNPIFERYVKILASTFKAPITEVYKIQAGFKYLAEFSEEARECIAPTEPASKTKKSKG